MTNGEVTDKAKKCCETLDCDNCPLREEHWCKEMLYYQQDMRESK